MSENSSPRSNAQQSRYPTPQTDWTRLADADPIAVRDPLAEVLGMVPDGQPLVLTFPEIAKAAGHACPAVAGAYRATQIAFDRLYPDSLPIRSEIQVTVGGDPSDSGFGPMANVIRHITGAADETGFVGFGGYGGRNELLEFGGVNAPGPGRAFSYTRTDTDDTAVVSFAPAALGVETDSSGAVDELLPLVVSGEANEEQREVFRETWHERVQRVLDASPGSNSPFTVALDRT